MDAGFVGEGVASDDGFVGLNRNTGNFAEQLTGGKKILGGDTCLVRIAGMTYAHGHDDLFERGGSRALADAVDGAFNLTGSSGGGGHGVVDGPVDVALT